MHRQKKTCIAMMLCAAMLSQSFVFDAYGTSAADSSVSKSASGASMFTLDKLGSVTLKQSVSVKLTDMNISVHPDGNILTYTLRYSNNSGSRVDLIDYFSKLSTPSGTIIKGKVVTSDAGKRTLPANSSQSVTYYVNIGRSAQVNGMKVSMFGWDFSSATYEKKLGGFTIPAQYSSVVPVGKSKKMKMNNISVTAKADTVQRYTINGKVYIKLGMKLSNGGTKVLSDPGYKAYLKSAGGSIFELLPESSSTGYKLQPQESRTIYYWTEIPSTMKTRGMTLQLAQEDETLKMQLPLQSFKLPAELRILPWLKAKALSL
ncbi:MULTISPECIES: hypothetical protein [Paenibacillus]|uniref:DUF4352 domain-containing protein n=1 Tax=Paenibacillus lactis 154 TaxID=743719 RepID=G4HJU2_9BACL|nr:hypothetical protein [Paenibacillus lactis]EHB62546.1 hypothetical protein PaelaDRAFT_4289 [Paenibacillus lactis 154]